MGAVRCDVCLGQEGPAVLSPLLPALLHEHLGIQTDEVNSCDACSQLLHLWDEFSREARVNLGGADQLVQPGDEKVANNIECPSENVMQEHNFTRHFQGICDMCNTTFKNIKSFNDHLNCVHSEHNFILFTNKHIIEDSDENKYKIVEFKKRSVYKQPYNCLYVCHICNKSFVSKHKLESHNKTDHADVNDSNQKSCDICIRELESGENILTHLVRLHVQSLDSKFKCPLCDSRFNSKSDVEFHLESLHFNIKSQFKCNLPCNKIVSSKHKLERHVNAVHVRTKPCFSCEHCAVEFSHKGKLRKHMLSDHLTRTEAKYPCEVTQKSPARSIGCTFCHKTFSSTVKMNMHITNRHQALSTANFCEEILARQAAIEHKVEDTTLQVNTLKRKNEENNDMNSAKHAKLSKTKADDFDYLKKDDMYLCNYCHKVTPLEMAIKLHLKKFHRIDFPKLKSIKIIEAVEQSDKNVASTSTGVNLKKESKCGDKKCTSSLDEIENANINPFTCKFCSTILASDVEFIEHLKEHVRNKKQKEPTSSTKADIAEIVTSAQYPCSECNERFTSQSDLYSHINKSHNTISELPCPVCFKTFTTVLGLTVHSQIHASNGNTEGLPLFACDVCGKELASKHGLVLHKKYTHPDPGKNSESKNSIFTCKFCDENLKNEEDFTQHLINHVRNVKLI